MEFEVDEDTYNDIMCKCDPNFVPTVRFFLLTRSSTHTHTITLSHTQSLTHSLTHSVRLNHLQFCNDRVLMLHVSI
jgi:hypothetical protein